MRREKEPKYYSFDAVTLAATSGVLLGVAGHETFILGHPSVEGGKLATLAGILAVIGYAKAKAARSRLPHQPLQKPNTT